MIECDTFDDTGIFHCPFAGIDDDGWQLVAGSQVGDGRADFKDCFVSRRDGVV